MSESQSLLNTLRVRLKEIFDIERRLRELLNRLNAAEFPAADHATTHQNGGDDEINVGGLSGVLADPQTVDTDPAGALDGDGAVATPLAVRVDGVTIIINGSNELEAVDAGSPGGSPGGSGETHRAITFIIDGGGTTITTGIKGDLSIPFACEIVGVRLLADQNGAIVIDIWNDILANFPPDNSDSITASAEPEITASNDSSEDTTLTGWDPNIAAGDILRFNVDSVTSIQRVTLTLDVVTA